MKQEFQSIAMLRKKFETLRISKASSKMSEAEPKASSTANLTEYISKGRKKNDAYTTDKLIEIVKLLRKENKSLKIINERQAKEIDELTYQLSKVASSKDEASSRPHSCLRSSKSVPKKNRVVFSKELVHVMNEGEQNLAKTLKIIKGKDESLGYSHTSRKRSKKMKYSDSQSPNKYPEENEYYTPLSSSLQEKKVISQSLLKHYDCSPKSKEKTKLFTKIIKF